MAAGAQLGHGQLDVTSDQIFTAAAVFGVVFAVTLWILSEHADEASALLKLATGKARKWLD